MFALRIKFVFQQTSRLLLRPYYRMANRTNFRLTSEQPNFPQEEEQILKYWESIDAFNQQIKLSEGKKPYTFYDGPPFATGMPHYGNLLAGTIKDIVCRFAVQTGHYVPRRWGWDCHGLPIEYQIDKDNNISNRQQVLDMGIDKYNQLCRSVVMKYAQEWKYTVKRLGRWIDMENDYKTMDLKFMESVWYVFKTMYEKGLVYRGCKVMPYSYGCSTVLSNFEVQQNFQDKTDPAVYVLFPLVSDPGVNLVAWTTTPWTLPSNLALCLNPDFEYLRLRQKKDNLVLIVASCRIKSLYKSEDEYEVLQRHQGRDLAGLEYVPLFPYFTEQFRGKAFRVVVDKFVTDDTGTGIVHCAPGFGEDDFNVCVREGIVTAENPPVPLDSNGCYTEQITDFKGLQIFEANKHVAKALRDRGRLLQEGIIKHSYPFCWRSDTPLIYKAIHCWFIRVTDIKEQLLANNAKSRWVPREIQEGRFNNWLQNARDWCFSRNRFWGNPIPIWVSDDFEERVCIGSVAELKELSGWQGEITDLHREFIDQITIPSKTGRGVLRRIDEVFDCWFESGAMPYGQVHYPWSCTPEEFEKIFPADFIAEGLDQTRGWFYTLNVVSTAVRNDTPYKNLIVNGIVLAADGKKMSKSKKNYTDPLVLVDQYGADALRLYMINSPLVRAESLKFKDKEVQDLQREVFLPWYNSYNMLVQGIQRWESVTGRLFRFDERLTSQRENLSANIMDAWITATLHNLIKFFLQEMANYRLYTVVPKLVEFLELLTNWYVRLNRPRLRGERGDAEAEMSLSVLLNVMLRQTILMSPFVPFVAEMFYQDLSKVLSESSPLRAKSVHFIEIPQPDLTLVDQSLEDQVRYMREIIFMGRKLREAKKLSLKQPLAALHIFAKNSEFLKGLDVLIPYLREELNVAHVTLSVDETSKYSEQVAQPVHSELAPLYPGTYSQKVLPKVKQLDAALQATLIERGEVEIEGQVCRLGVHFTLGVRHRTEAKQPYEEISGDTQFTLLLDTRQDESLINKGLAREFQSTIQQLRKSAKLNPSDRIVIFFQIRNPRLQNAVLAEKESIGATLKRPYLDKNLFYQEHLRPIPNASETKKTEDLDFDVVICRESVRLAPGAANKFGEHFPKLVEFLKSADYEKLREEAEKTGKLELTLGEGQKLELVLNTDFYLSWHGLW